jgi:UDP-N-acetylmuramoyl-tripeptide--D-alanyl-D-alanine ligase
MHGFKVHFTVSTSDGDYEGGINYPYPHLVENFLAAVAVGRLLNVGYDDILASTKLLSLPSGRGDLVQCGELYIINDCYNASLEAVEKAIVSLDMIDYAPKYALIGEIGEIGGYELDIYERLLAKIRGYKDIKFILSGDSYMRFEPESNIVIVRGEEATVEALNGITKGLILVKASRSFGFERYIERLKACVEG